MRVYVILMVISAFVLIGCTKTPEEVRRTKLNDKINGCVSSITNVSACGKYESKLRKIIEELKCETNTIVRDGLADRLSELVLQVDLTPNGCEYGELENRIERYIQCAGAAAILQQETKGDRQWRGFFIKSGIKLKQACFSVSWEARRRDETAEEYRRRKSAAENLYNAYEQEVALWKCYKGTGGKSLLQPEIREEFIRQSESLFNYPRRNELLSHPEYQGK